VAHKHNLFNVGHNAFHVIEITIKSILAVVLYDNFVMVVEVVPNVIKAIPGGTGTVNINKIHDRLKKPSILD
jgi:L-ribulose-5-phosphate 3-epimerase UlaE